MAFIGLMIFLGSITFRNTYLRNCMLCHCQKNPPLPQFLQGYRLRGTAKSKGFTRRVDSRRDSREAAGFKKL
jgi:hypothetical protein